MRPIILGIAGLAAVAGCTPAAPPVKSLVLVEGGVTATAPAGYCIDPGSSNPDAGFAVMAPCATLGSGDNAPDVLGVATVQVGAPASGMVADNSEGLISLLGNDAGAGLLSASGNGGDITVIAAEAEENTVTVHFNDDGVPPIKGLDAEEWRAFTDINGRLVTVAVRGLASAPLTEGTGSWLLGLVVTGLLGTDENTDASASES